MDQSTPWTEGRRKTMTISSRMERLASDDLTVTADLDKCTACGACVLECPEVFAQGRRRHRYSAPGRLVSRFDRIGGGRRRRLPVRCNRGYRPLTVPVWWSRCERWGTACPAYPWRRGQAA
ncbi:hypothetical protein CJ179_47245 [Rhodococcus sp. ACS1]|uniref:ferredoxin n=1 Tax=Rhodococcus sp. ACS1 TaxID=2028570 RepID=UPI000BB0FFEC|nr:hypothetical protein CJ179_47245 [Rhodococcus sp. ACS1]